MNAQQVVAYHIQMAKMFHRYIIPILRRKEQESLRVNRRLRDEHLAMAREVKRLVVAPSVMAVHGDELIRRTQLIKALIEDWRDTLTSEPWQAEAILKNGFPGYEYMTTAELEKQAADAGLCDEDLTCKSI